MCGHSFSMPSRAAWLSDQSRWWDHAEMEEVSDTPAIQTLDLSNRQLTHTSLQLLPNALTCLDLSRCGLEQAAALHRLPRLELLNLSYNRLSSTDDTSGNVALKVLYGERCPASPRPMLPGGDQGSAHVSKVRPADMRSPPRLQRAPTASRVSKVSPGSEGCSRST